MTIGFVFWLLMLLWAIFSFWWYWQPQPQPGSPWGLVGNVGLVFILFLLLGIQVFGWPIKT